jgi:hypothetical protein
MSKCIKKTVVVLETSESSLVPYTYQLEFSRSTNLNKSILVNNYKVILTFDENTDISTLPNTEMVLGYSFY